MAYLAKLAHRIARIRFVLAPVTLLFAACSKGDKVDFLSPNPNPTSPALHMIRVEPQITSVHSGSEVQFIATGYSAAGQVVPVTVDWTAEGGDITPSGKFVGQTSGQFHVVARARAQASIADSAFVSVWSNPTEFVDALVSPDSAVLEEGDSLQFTATLVMANGDAVENVAVDWSANGGSIDQNGVFTSLTSGQFAITASTPVGLRKTLTTLVRPRTRRMLSLEIDPDWVQLDQGGGTTFNVTATWSDGSSSPTPVLWSATGGSINSNGQFTAGSKTGNFQVIARATQSDLADTALVSIARPAVARLSLTPDAATVQPGASIQFGAQAQLSDQSWTQVPLSWDADGGTINSNGLYTADQVPGTYHVVVHTPGSSETDTSIVVVSSPVATLTQLLLNPSTVTMGAGSSRQFSVTGIWSDGSVTTPAVTWSATGGTITGSGNYTATAGAGNYRVIASAGGKADTSSVVITAAVLTSLTVAPSATTLQPGQSVSMSASGVWSDGSTTPPSVAWNADGGTITAAGLYVAGPTPGTYAIVGRQQSGTLADTAFVTISLAPASLSGLLLSPASVTVAPNNSTQFNVSGVWSDGSTTPPPVVYTTNGGSITSSGRFTAGSTPGTYRVIATHQGGTKADTSVVVVPSAVVLTGLYLGPKPLSILVGTQQQFSVSATWSNGTTSVPLVTLTATGGTITTSGRYTAGLVPGNYKVIVRQTSGTVSDTADVTVTAAPPPPAPTLSSLTLTPASASVQTGGTKQFVVGALWSDGSTSLPSISWTATGGTVNSSGLYTAGTAAGTYRVIARDPSSGKADTSSVTVSSAPSAPTLTSVVIAPGSVSLLTGALQQFTVQGLYSDGSTGAVSVNWTATGGSISTGGLFLAGLLNGSFKVIATQQGGTLADTAAVTLTLSPPTQPPGGALYPNEPSGMTWTNQRSFNAKVESGWGDRGDPYFSIVNDPTAPTGSSNVGQARFPAGFPAGQGPIATWIVLPNGLRTVYVCYWIKLSSNWYGNQTGTNKIMFFSIGGTAGGTNTSRAFTAARGIGSATHQAEIDFQGMVTGTGHPVSWNGMPSLNMAAASLTRGQWQKWEILMVANTPGQWDGEAHWWINGIKVGQYTNVGFTLASETGSLNTWHQLNWNPTFGGTGAAVPADQFMWMDHIYVSGK